jgi:hypothetical protein
MKNLLLALSFISLLAFANPPAAHANDFGTLIFNHQIAVGMTFGNVQAAWGKPYKIDRSVGSYGTTEYWFFNADNGGVWLVVFENGRVASFHQ